MKQIPEDCKGCYENGASVFSKCPFIKQYRFLECPCRICLLKGICGNTCEEYESFRESRLRSKS